MWWYLEIRPLGGDNNEIKSWEWRWCPRRRHLGVCTLSLWPPRGHSKKVAISKPGREFSLGTNVASTLILDLSSEKQRWGGGVPPECKAVITHTAWRETKRKKEFKLETLENDSSALRGAKWLQHSSSHSDVFYNSEKVLFMLLICEPDNSWS